MTTKELTAKFGLIDFDALATAAGRAEVEKRLKAIRADASAAHKVLKGVKSYALYGSMMDQRKVATA